MTLEISSGRLRITDGIATVFDTDDKLFHTITTINGSRFMSAVFANDTTRINVTNSFNLGSVNSSCTQVMGAVKFTLTTVGGGVQFNRWHTMMGGTVVWVMDGEPGILSALGNNAGIRQYMGYSFRISSGNLFLDQRVYMDTSNIEISLKSHSIDYKLHCGVWV